MDAGLCASCAHAQLVASLRGSQFSLCRLSFTDSRFPRYPVLPVLACGGWREMPAAPAQAAAGQAIDERADPFEDDGP